MNALAKSHLLASRLLAHKLENVSLADVEASLSCRSAMIQAAMDAVVEVAIKHGCQEHHEGAMRVLVCVLNASGFGATDKRRLVLEVHERIDAAYRGETANEGDKELVQQDAAHDTDMNALRKEQLAADCGGDMADDFDVRELVSSPRWHTRSNGQPLDTEA